MTAQRLKAMERENDRQSKELNRIFCLRQLQRILAVSNVENVPDESIEIMLVVLKSYRKDKTQDILKIENVMRECLFEQTRRSNKDGDVWGNYYKQLKRVNL
jgi:Asp-tRNA(Asn)/Glu-tRNA(Gln) amidotransferase C subunit